MDTNLTLMMNSKLFAGFSKGECKKIYTLIGPVFRSFSKNEIIFREGDKIDYLGVLAQGKLISTKIDYEGNNSLENIIEAHRIFGLDIVTTPTQISPINLTSIENSAVLQFSYAALVKEQLLSEQEQLLIMNNIMTLLANENMRRLYKIELLCQKSLRKRIIMYLRFIANKTGSNRIIIPFNREQLAQYLNVNRSALSWELGQMQRDGLITFYKNEFVILDESMK